MDVRDGKLQLYGDGFEWAGETSMQFNVNLILYISDIRNFLRMMNSDDR